MTFPTGLRKRSEATRQRFAAERPYLRVYLPLKTVFQPVEFLHDQAQKGSCVGQAWTGRLETKLGVRLSGVDLWTDARRRQGDLQNATTGTDSDHAIESFLHRGVSPYVEGEDERPFNEDQELATVGQELAADDERLAVDAEHRVVVGSRTPAVVDALQRGLLVCTGGGVRDPYFSLATNQVADEVCLGGDENGHEQGIAGYIADGDDRFPAAWWNCTLWVNSWGQWGGVVLPCDVTRTDGLVLPSGTLLRGCALVTAGVLESQWDVDLLEWKAA